MQLQHDANIAGVAEKRKRAKKHLNCLFSTCKSCIFLANAEKRLNVVRRKIMDFVANECPFCGYEKLSRLLEKPLVTDEAYEELAAQWRT